MWSFLKGGVGMVRSFESLTGGETCLVFLQGSNIITLQTWTLTSATSKPEAFNLNADSEIECGPLSLRPDITWILIYD